MEAAKIISNRHPEVVWMICGNDNRLFQQLPVSYKQKVRQPGVPPGDWPKVVKSFDIGVAPLSGIYDQHRSWIKGVEYALAGVPWVGIEGATYDDLADWPTATLIPEGAEFWEAALEDCISNIEERQQQANSLILDARERFLVDNNLDKYSEVYNRIISDHAQKDPDDVLVLPGVFAVG
jgi:hypothetical protein